MIVAPQLYDIGGTLRAKEVIKEVTGIFIVFSDPFQISAPKRLGLKQAASTLGTGTVVLSKVVRANTKDGVEMNLF